LELIVLNFAIELRVEMREIETRFITTRRLTFEEWRDCLHSDPKTQKHEPPKERLREMAIRKKKEEEEKEEEEEEEKGNL